MSELRLIILIIGLFFVGAVFYWEMRRIKKTQSPKFPDRNQDVDYARLGSGGQGDDAQDDHAKDDHARDDYAAAVDEIEFADDKAVEAIDIMLDTPPKAVPNFTPDPVHHRVPEPVAELVDKPVAEPVAQPASDDLFSAGAEQQLDIAEAELSPAGHQADHKEPALISLFVVAKRERIPARQLFNALEACGFRYGEMRIYHHFGHDLDGHEPPPVNSPDKLTGKPLFSAANMHEPGFFEPELADSDAAPPIKGVALFFSTDRQTASRPIFDLMLQTARQLAVKTAAEVCDGRHEPLTDASLHQLHARLERLDAE